MRHAYDLLLRLYPSSYRTLFGSEMSAVFSLASAHFRERGLVAWLVFLASELSGLVGGAVVQWGSQKRTQSDARWALRVALTGALSLTAAIFIQGFAFVGLTRPHSLRRVPPPPAADQSHFVLLLSIISLSILMIAVLSIAFFWNMRTLNRNRLEVPRYSRARPRVPLRRAFRRCP